MLDRFKFEKETVNILANLFTSMSSASKNVTKWATLAVPNVSIHDCSYYSCLEKWEVVEDPTL